jgi:glycosyltransferase involved in cell wall biosynthesis
MADELKFRLKVPVILFFQGEDSFLDHLPEPFRTKCWKRMAERLPSANALVAPSHFYGSYMEGRLDFLEGMIEVIRNGLHLEEYLAVERKDVWPTIGYMARMSRDKGLEMVVDAFIHLKKSLGDKTTRLKIAGAATAGDQPFINEMKKRIAAAKLDSWVEWMPNITHEEKLTFLSSLMLFSVPATYTEAFGLYLVEAIACGVPVVQPDSASFPEIVEATGCGVCVPRGFPEALAQSWYGLLADTERRKAMSRAGRESVASHFDVRAMSEQFLKLANRLVDVAA